MKNRKLWQVETLGKILREFSGASKHATWLLIQSAFYDDIPNKVSERALKLTCELLSDSGITSYARYRILFWLVSRYNKRNNYKPYIAAFLPHSKDNLIDLCKSYLAEPAIELNLVAILTLHTIGFSNESIKNITKQHCIKPMADPIRNAINCISPSKAEPAHLLVEDDFENLENYLDYI